MGAGLEPVVAELRANISNFSAGMTTAAGQMKSFEASVAAAAAGSGRHMDTIGQKVDRAAKSMTSAGKSMSLGFTLPVVAIGALAVREAVKFESAFTGVTKTVNATDAQMATLRQGIIDMSKQMPASTTQIASVAEAAGQLGVQTDSILGFTKVMIELGDTTNLSADDAATSMARMMNVMGTAPQNVERLGSTLVALGNSGASTEAEIVAMSLRLAGAGKLIGASESGVLGLANAMSSMGIESELGGGSMSRTMLKMYSAVKSGGSQLSGFAKVAGEAPKVFAKEFQGQPMQAIDGFIHGLGRIKDHGGNVVSVMSKLGMSGTQDMQVLLRMVGAGDLLTQSLRDGSMAWQKNTALSAEAAKRYATTAAQWEIFKNNIADLARTMGEALVPALTAAVQAAKPLIDFTKSLADSFKDSSSGTKKWILGISAGLLALGPALYIGGKLLTVFKGIGTGTAAIIRATSGLAGANAANALFAESEIEVSAAIARKVAALEAETIAANGAAAASERATIANRAVGSSVLSKGLTPTSGKDLSYLGGLGGRTAGAEKLAGAAADTEKLAAAEARAAASSGRMASMLEGVGGAADALSSGLLGISGSMAVIAAGAAAVGTTMYQSFFWMRDKDFAGGDRPSGLLQQLGAFPAVIAQVATSSEGLPEKMQNISAALQQQTPLYQVAHAFGLVSDQATNAATTVDSSAAAMQRALAADKVAPFNNQIQQLGDRISRLKGQRADLPVGLRDDATAKIRGLQRELDALQHKKTRLDIATLTGQDQIHPIPGRGGGSLPGAAGAEWANSGKKSAAGFSQALQQGLAAGVPTAVQRAQFAALNIATRGGVTTGRAMSTGFSKAIKQGFASVPSLKIKAPVVPAPKVNAGAGSAAGAKLGGAVASGIASTKGQTAAAGSAIGAAATSAAAGQMSGGSSIGASLGAGVVAGIMSQIGAVQSAGSALGAAAAAATRTSAGVQSPSKLTRYDGEMMGQGLIDGLNARSGKAKDAAHHLAKGAASALQELQWAAADAGADLPDKLIKGIKKGQASAAAAAKHLISAATLKTQLSDVGVQLGAKMEAGLQHVNKAASRTVANILKTMGSLKDRMDEAGISVSSSMALAIGKGDKGALAAAGNMTTAAEQIKAQMDAAGTSMSSAITNALQKGTPAALALARTLAAAAIKQQQLVDIAAAGHSAIDSFLSPSQMAQFAKPAERPWVAMAAGLGTLKDAMDAANSTMDSMNQAWADFSGTGSATDMAIRALQDAKQQFEQITGSIKQFGSVVDSAAAAANSATGIGGIHGSAAAAANSLQTQQKKLDQATAFLGELAQLKGLGLNQESLNDLINAGVEQGSKVAAEIIAQGQLGVNLENQLQGALGSVARQIGELGSGQANAVANFQGAMVAAQAANTAAIASFQAAVTAAIAALHSADAAAGVSGAQAPPAAGPPAATPPAPGPGPVPGAPDVIRTASGSHTIQWYIDNWFGGNAQWALSKNSALAWASKPRTHVVQNGAQIHLRHGMVGIQGMGTGTSDSILAAISRGESVMTAAATAANAPALRAMNAGAVMTMPLEHRPAYRPLSSNESPSVVHVHQTIHLSSQIDGRQLSTEVIKVSKQYALRNGRTELAG